MARALQFTRGSQRSVLYLTHRINVSKWISRAHSVQGVFLRSELFGVVAGALPRNQCL